MRELFETDLESKNWCKPDLFPFNSFQFGPGELGMVRSYYAKDNADYEEVNSWALPTSHAITPFPNDFIKEKQNGFTTEQVYPSQLGPVIRAQVLFDY